LLALAAARSALGVMLSAHNRRRRHIRQPTPVCFTGGIGCRRCRWRLSNRMLAITVIDVGLLLVSTLAGACVGACQPALVISWLLDAVVGVAGCWWRWRRYQLSHAGGSAVAQLLVSSAVTVSCRRCRLPTGAGWAVTTLSLPVSH
jgi:hypothetical protein